jgi:transcriptional regulator with XRE-family HTH domain
LARRRKTVGLTQEGLAEVVGVDSSTVRRWEAGTTEPLPWMRPRLAKVLNISVDALAGLLDEDDETRNEEHDQFALVATVLADALGVPTHMNVIQPEHQPTAMAHRHPGPCDHTLKELGTFVRFDMLTRRETLNHAVKAMSGAAMLAPMAGWLDTPLHDLQARDHGTQRIGAADVEAIERSTRFFASTDADIGGALSREAAAGQLKYAVDLARSASYSQATGRRLLAAVAELSGLVGFMCVDSGMMGPAQRYFIYGLRAARESTDPRAPLLVVSILSDMAQQMRWLDRPQAALRLYDLAAQELPADPRRHNVLRAVLAAKRAEDALCHLDGYQQAEARSALSMSFDLYARADADDRTAAPNMWHRCLDMSEGELFQTAAAAHLVMAKEDKNLAAEAEKYTQLQIANVAPGQGRDKAFGLIRLARIRFLAGEPEQASHDGDRAIEAAEHTSSTMVKHRLCELLAESEPYADVPRVMELRDRLRTLTTKS